MKVYTSFYDISHTRPEFKTLTEFYTTALIPLWRKYCIAAGLDPWVITNKPIPVEQNIVTEDLLNGFDEDIVTPVSSQIYVYESIMQHLVEGEICLYLDPDAFILHPLNVRAYENIVDYAVNKKLIPYGDADAGVAFLRKVTSTREFITSLQGNIDNYDTCLIETHINRYKQGKFFSGKFLPVLLGGTQTYMGYEQPCIVHGDAPDEIFSQYTIPKEVIEILHIKSKLRHGVY